MMQVITQILLGFITVGCSALQCWVCEDVSGEEGGCGDIDMKGELKTCPDEKALGCYISTYTSKANLSTVVAVHRLLILQDINATNTSLPPRLFGRACVRVMVVMKTTTLQEVPSFHATNAAPRKQMPLCAGKLSMTIS